MPGGSNQPFGSKKETVGPTAGSNPNQIMFLSDLDKVSNNYTNYEMN